MNPKLISYMQTPIPRGLALAVIVGQGLANMVIVCKAVNDVAKKANETLADQTERLAIYDETVELLLAEASPETCAKLNDKLDYWRVIRGQSVRSPKE